MTLKERIKAHKEQIINLIEYLKEKLHKKEEPQRWVLRFDAQGVAKVKLASLLTEVGLFSFYSSNSGKLINVSQVVYYLNCGWKALERGYTAGKQAEIEIHHLNGDVTDDAPRNLVALSTGDHYYASACQNGTFNLQDFFWQNHRASDNPTPFNNQGRAIKNHSKFLQRIIAATIYNTQRWLEKAAMRAGAKIKQTVHWVLKKLGQAVERGVQAIKAIAVNPQERSIGEPLLSSSKTTWQQLRQVLTQPIKPVVKH